MLTRCHVPRHYGEGGYAPPPYHVSMHPHQYPPLPQRGGLAGGAVLLSMPSAPRPTGYGYLGMDPSDPSSWPRPFNPSLGMIGFLNGGPR